MNSSEIVTNIDTIKREVSTLPLKRSGSNFKTNVLIEASNSKLVYKPSIGMAIFAFLFLAVGLTIIFFSLFPVFESTANSKVPNWVLALFGLIFASAGGAMFYFSYMPRVFDKKLGLYYKSYKPELHRSNKDISKKQLSLKSIVAIQIIGEHVKGDKKTYKSFELNLVLSDASRKNVVDHGNLNSILNDAEMLSEFLNIPTWHAESGTA